MEVKPVPRAREILTAIFAGGMELCWLCCLASFLFSLFAAGEIPLSGGIFAFGLAAVLGAVAGNRGWRIISILGLNLAGFVLALWLAVYTCASWPAPIYSLQWLAVLGARLQDFASGLPLGAVIFLVLLSWFFGFCFARRPLVYATVTSRFDLGVIIFFFLFLFEGGLGEQMPSMSIYLFLFFLFSLLSIALTRSRGSGKKEYHFSFGRLGLVFLLFLAVLLFAAGAVFFFLPGLSDMAKTGYLLGGKLLAPLLNFFLKILALLFFRRSLRQEPAGAESGGGGFSATETITGGEVQLWEKLFTLGISIFLGIVLLIAVGWSLYHLYLWLLTRTAGPGKAHPFWKQLLALFANLRERCRFLLLSAVKVFAISMQRGEGARGYKKLLFWGKSGGFPRYLTETPGEYGTRLQGYFPLFGMEIGTIIQSYHDEIYGELQLDRVQGRRIKLAWRR